MHLTDMADRILCIDLGDVRTGIAVSDELGMFAHGVTLIKEDYLPHTAEKVAEQVKKYNASLVVLGYPLNMNGSAGPRAERVVEFKKLLEDNYGFTVVLFDERLTTVSAHNYLNMTNTRGKKRKNTVDILSAEIILQNYLDSKKTK